ncbi:Uncharacterized protein PCOAH_00003270 [Plasmodium coatneyi]|uniref:Uncharacterized protein n=1 Tax=Plasmodium coatneyi TaxID=208452 RepID=A0A1B1DT66_9APIC|nr:Uncharacterized protein PCOAH_00003270 [Plasmodium coatneyi]ANQ05942.1 Uncharacterized protein PCOAH_00003270 [Plasmodium coatneyi]
MEVDFVSAQGRDARGLMFDKGGDASSDVADEELEKPLGESIILEEVKECFIGRDDEKDCTGRKSPREADANEADSSPREIPICENEQLEVSPNGANINAVKEKIEDSEKTGEEAACRGKSELSQLDGPDVETGNTIAAGCTNQRRRLTPKRQGETERINQLYKNPRSTNINLYRRMYQSYLLLRKEQNELLAQNRKKEERNMKLKYELDSLRGNSYYSNFFFNNDSDNLFEELASGISNIWKWMDLESKSVHVMSGQKGKGGPTAFVGQSEGGVPPCREVKEGKAPHGGMSPQAVDKAKHDGKSTCEYASAQNDVPTEGSAEGGTSCGKGVSPSEERPDEHSEGYEPTSGAPPNGVQPNGERSPMACEHRTNTTSEVPMESPSLINEKEATQTMEGRISPQGRDTQQATTNNGGQKKKVNLVKVGHKHPDMNNGNKVNLPPSHKSPTQDDRMEKKNSFLWEKESRPVKRGCVKYGRLHSRFADQERSSARVDRKPGSFTSMEFPKDNIVDYIKGRLSNGGRIHGKATLPSGQKVPMGVQPNWIKQNDHTNRKIMKEEENFLYHICNCRENKYVPLNVGSFYMVPPKRTLPDEDFSLGSLQKCMDFILRRKERGNHREVRVKHKKCSNAPCEGIPPENATPNVRALNEQKESPPVGKNNGEEEEKKTRIVSEVVLKKGDRTAGLDVTEEKQVLKKGKSGRKNLLKVDGNGRSNKGGAVQNCQLKRQKGKKYNTQKMDACPGRKFGHIMSSEGSTRRRNLFGGFTFKVIPRREEKGEEVLSPVVKVKRARLVSHTKGHPGHVRFGRVGRRFFSLRGSKLASSGLEEVGKGEKNQNGGKSEPSELPPKVHGNSGFDGKEDNLVGRDTLEGHAAPHEYLQRENDSVAKRDLLIDALAKHVQSLDLSTRRIDCIEEENKDAVTIIGIQIRVTDGHIYLHLDGLSTIEESVTVWIKKNEKILNGYVKSSEIIRSTLEYYCVDMFTFVCIFLDALENYVQEFPFYLSLSLEDIFCVHRGS